MTASARPDRVLILGAGAIGSFYGAALQTQGADVSVVCRSDFAAVSRDGIAVHSARMGDRHLRPAQVVRTAADYAGGPPDYLVVCVKVVEGTDRPALMRAAVGPETVIVLIENGIEIEQDIAAAFPRNEIISGLAFVQVSRVAPGTVRHHAFGDLHLGTYPAGVTERTRRFATMLQAGGIRCVLADDVVTARWQKCVWNAVFNPISILGAALDTGDILGADGGREFVRRAMQEVCAIAAAAGHALPPELPDQLIDGTAKAPPYKTSMALDYENGRPLEIEVVLGNTVRAARREGVSAPALETLYALAKIVERKMARQAAAPV